jgi:hypothetical protein
VGLYKTFIFKNRDDFLDGLFVVFFKPIALRLQGLDKLCIKFVMIGRIFTRLVRVAIESEHFSVVVFYVF